MTVTTSISSTCTPFRGRVGIAGAGLLGRLLAWKLLQQGCGVTLFDSDNLLSRNPGQQHRAAAYTAAGMIAPFSEAVATEKLAYDMGMQSLALWPDWLQALQQESGESIDYQQQGSLVIAHPQDRAELRQFETDLQRMLGDDARYESLDRAAIHNLEPDLAPHFSQGLLLPVEAHIDNRRLLDVLLQHCLQMGLECRDQCEVTCGPHQIHTAARRYDFDLVIDSRGVGAKPEWSAVRGVRGEVLGVHTPEVTLNRPVRLMHPRYQLYVVPKAEQHFVIGATQIESEDRSPVSVQSSLELCSALYTLSPAFAEARIIEQISNLRPTLIDNRPRVQWQTGLIRVNGLFRHGYLLAPCVINHLLNRLNRGGALPFDQALGLEEPEHA